MEELTCERLQDNLRHLRLYRIQDRLKAAFEEAAKNNCQ